MNVNELRVRWANEQAEADMLRRTLTGMLPKPVEANGVRVAFFPAGVEVIGSGTLLNDATAEQLRDAFLAAYPVGPLDTAPDAGWVSVDNRWPDDVREVLVYAPGPRVPIRIGWRHRDGHWFEYGGNGQPLAITHWRELPEPPAARGGSSE